MLIPSDLFYTKAHIWIKKIESDLLIGITDFAQDSMGEIGYVDLPSVGDKLKKDSCFGNVETAKVVSDLFAPLDAMVAEVNQELDEKPEIVNELPYEAGWMLRLTDYKIEDLNELLDAQAYTKCCE